MNLEKMIQNYKTETKVVPRERFWKRFTNLRKL